MKNFKCDCGQTVYFENTYCQRCKKTLGYDPQTAKIIALKKTGPDTWLTTDGQAFQPCRNYLEYNVCNWLTQNGQEYCPACRLNKMVPSLHKPENRREWAALETAKRRLLYTLYSLKLPVISKLDDPERGLGFAFLEDKRRNPNVKDEYVLTGHAKGLITVNLLEADSANREWLRLHLGEAYRTLLGHFRHESGHYYFDLLIRDSKHIENFRTLFGDEREDYDTALAKYYDSNNFADPENRYISSYSAAHPLEDWAEIWAHYLHMIDTLETAATYDLLDHSILEHPLNDRINAWVKLSMALNGMNRSMGLNDAYPFVLSPIIIEKFHFLHSVIYPTSSPNSAAATAEKPL